MGQMKERIKGKVKISNTSALILDGDITLSGLVLNGALELSGSGEVKDLIVENEGMPWEAIPEMELKDADPSHQIRGYRQVVKKLDSRQVHRSLKEMAVSAMACCTTREKEKA